MIRQYAVHRHWSGYLLLREEDQTLTLEATGTSGRYEVNGDRLAIFWDTFPREDFVRQGETYVLSALAKDRPLPNAKTAPWIQIAPLGNMANQMIQYLVADRIHSLVPGSVIHGFNLPSWQLSDPTPFIAAPPSETHSWQTIPIESIAQRLTERSIASVVLAGYFQRIEYFPSLDRCREIFPQSVSHHPGFGEDILVINIRAGEILTGEHHQYTLVPVDYYKEIIAKTGLRPVFMGQVDPGPYRTYLESHFPEASFLVSQGIIEDFAIIRRSTNIVLSVSTFSWLAAWLSHARRIFMPLTGFYNPFQDRDVNFVPEEDERYVYHLFPINYAVPFELLDSAHQPINHRWTQVSSSMLKSMNFQYPRYGSPDVDDYAAAFDDKFYLARNSDVRSAVTSGHFRRVFEHFYHHGFREMREPFEFDRKWYSQTYPDAAVEVGRGDFASMRDHYVMIGRARGYLPHP